MSTKLVAKDTLRNLSGSEAGPGAEGVDTITGDMMKYLTRRPDLCLHQLSPGLCILFRRLLDHLTGLLVQEHMPPRPRPSIGPTIQPASHFRSLDVSPERPPGQWQPPSFTAPSQKGRSWPASPSKSQAEGPLL